MKRFSRTAWLGAVLLLRIPLWSQSLFFPQAGRSMAFSRADSVWVCSRNLAVSIQGEDLHRIRLEGVHIRSSWGPPTLRVDSVLAVIVYAGPVSDRTLPLLKGRQVRLMAAHRIVRNWVTGPWTFRGHSEKDGIAVDAWEGGHAACGVHVIYGSRGETRVWPAGGESGTRKDRWPEAWHRWTAVWAGAPELRAGDASGLPGRTHGDPVFSLGIAGWTWPDLESAYRAGWRVPAGARVEMARAPSPFAETGGAHRPVSWPSCPGAWARIFSLAEKGRCLLQPENRMSPGDPDWLREVIEAWKQTGGGDLILYGDSGPWETPFSFRRMAVPVLILRRTPVP